MKKGVCFGYDAGKRIKGRKRHILVDTLELLHSLVIQPASVQGRVGAKALLEKAKDPLFRLKKIWADGGYTGILRNWAAERFGWDIEITEKAPGLKVFQVLPKRWVALAG